MRRRYTSDWGIVHNFEWSTPRGSHGIGWISTITRPTGCASKSTRQARINGALSLEQALGLTPHLGILEEIIDFLTSKLAIFSASSSLDIYSSHS